MYLDINASKRIKRHKCIVYISGGPNKMQKVKYDILKNINDIIKYRKVDVNLYELFV